MDAVVRGPRPQQRQVARTPAAEMEVVSDQDPACFERFHQHLVDEFLGRKRREPGVEPRDVDTRHAV
jgi:hypothetical protein